MPDITHIKIPKVLRDELKIKAIRMETTLYKLTVKIFKEWLKKHTEK